MFITNIQINLTKHNHHISQEPPPRTKISLSAEKLIILNYHHHCLLVNHTSAKKKAWVKTTRAQLQTWHDANVTGKSSQKKRKEDTHDGKEKTKTKSHLLQIQIMSKPVSSLTFLKFVARTASVAMAWAVPAVTSLIRAGGKRTAAESMDSSWSTVAVRTVNFLGTQPLKSSAANTMWSSVQDECTVKWYMVRIR